MSNNVIIKTLHTKSIIDSLSQQVLLSQLGYTSEQIISLNNLLVESAGSDSFSKGESLDINPYEKNTLDYQIWKKGFLKKQAETLFKTAMSKNQTN